MIRNFSITKNGKSLDELLYKWDIGNRTLTTNENGLVLDFNKMDNIKFKTGYSCIFKTGYDCKFDTGSRCTFITESNCNFITKDGCIFDVHSGCSFDIGNECTIDISLKYDEMKHGKECVVILRRPGSIKIINLDDEQSVRFLKED